MPPTELDKGVQVLRDEAPSSDAEDVLDYFVGTYVSGTFRPVRQRRQGQDGPNGIVTVYTRQPPLFPPETWSVFQRTLDGVDRTNNSSEGWNHAYGEMVGHSGPTIWYSIKTIRLDESKVHTMIRQHRTGRVIEPTNPPKQKYKKLNERLQRLCQQYTLGRTNISDYLKAISCNVLQSRRR